MAKPDLCPICHEITQIDAITLREDYPLKKGTVEIKAQVYQCTVCEGTFTDVKQEEFNYELAVEVLRKEKGLLFPSEIKEIREKYNLSQRQFSALLGWSPTTLSSYENNKIQERSHNDELVLLEEPANMNTLFLRNRGSLGEKAAEELAIRLRELLRSERERQQYAVVSTIYDGIDVGHLTGDRPFDLIRFIRVAQYILSETGRVFKTKLLKLLFYSDFLSYKRHRMSLTGTVYAKGPYGPVPDNFDVLLGFLQSQGVINATVHQFADGGEGEILATEETVDQKHFSQEDLRVMTDVVRRFKDSTATQVSEQSHKEAAYLRTGAGDYISYRWAKELSLD